MMCPDGPIRKGSWYFVMAFFEEDTFPESEELRINLTSVFEIFLILKYSFSGLLVLKTNNNHTGLGRSS